MKKIIALTLMLALGACTSLKDNIDAAKLAGGGDPVKVLGSFIVTDLKAAASDAKLNNDVVSLPCYEALIPLVEKFSERGPSTGVAGGFSAFQKARDLLNSRSGGVPDTLKIACAPVVLDTQQTIIRLGVIAGGAAVTGGATLPLLGNIGNLQSLLGGLHP